MPPAVNSHHSLSGPRTFILLSGPTDFIHPNGFSTQYRLAWLIRQLGCRVVRPSIALELRLSWSGAVCGWKVADSGPVLDSSQPRLPKRPGLPTAIRMTANS